MKTATSGFISAISDGCPYHTVKFYLLGAEIDVIVKSFPLFRYHSVYTLFKVNDMIASIFARIVSSGQVA